jgi:thiamine biosynthesis lipoprotein
VGRINAAIAGRAVGVDPSTATVLASALRWAEASGGAFDPAIGRVVELWNVNEAHAPPAEALVRRLAGRQLYRQVQLGHEGGAPAVAVTSRDVALDLGGIAKGYGVDRAVEALRAHGMANALVNVGGDLYAAGTAGDGDPWRVGIQAPGVAGAIVGSLAVQDRAIATSGDYEQGFGYRGVRYHHLMDPATAAPRRVATHSITIEAASCMDADAAATTVFGWTSERANAVLAVQAPGARVVSWG